MRILLSRLLDSIMTVENYPILSYLVTFVELLTFMSVLLIDNTKKIQTIQKLLGSVTGTDTFNYLFYWVYFGLALVTMMALLLLRFLKQQNQAVGTFLSVCYVILQLTVIMFLATATSLFEASLADPGLYLTFFCLIPFNIALVAIQQEVHIFDLGTFPIFFLKPFIPSNYWNALFLGFALLVAKQVTTLHQRFGVFSVIVLLIWDFCHSQLTNVLEFVQLGVYLIVLFIGCLYLKEWLIHETKQTFLLRLASQAIGMNNTLVLPMKQKVKMLQIFSSQDYENDSKVKDFLNLVIEDKVTKKQIISILSYLNNIQNKHNTHNSKENKWLALQLELFKGQNILKIYSLLNSISPDNIEETITLEKAKLKAAKLKTIRNTIADIALIQKANTEIFLFQENIYNCMTELIAFWQKVSETTIQIQRINQHLETVLNHQEKARKNLKFIQSVQPLRQEKIVFQVFSQLINHFIPQEKPEKKASRQVGKPNSSLQNIQFIVFNGNIIEEMSEGLAEEFGLSNQKKHHCLLSDIVAPQLYSLIFDKPEQYSEDFYLPLVIEKQLIVKKASIHLLPVLEKSIKHIIIFKNTTIDESIFFNVQSNQILYFSPVLDENISYEPKMHTLKSMPKESLNIQFSHDDIQLLRQGKFLSIQMHKMYFRNTKGPICNQNQMIKNAISLLHEYKTSENHFMLIEIKYNKAQFSSSPSFNEIKLSYLIQQTQIPSSVAFAHETAFCQIKNPYSENIKEKLQNSHFQRYISNAGIIAILLGFLLISIIVTSSMLVSFSSERFQLQQMYLRQGGTLNAQYKNILSLFYESHILYFTKNYPEEIKKWNPKLSQTTLLGYYEKSLDSTIKMVLQTEQKNPLQKYKNKIDYILKYGLYNVSCTTTQNDIIKLLAEVKQFLKTYNVTFLVDNYDQIRSLEQAYRVESVVIRRASQVQPKTELLLILSLVIQQIFVLGIFIILVKTKRIFDNIHKYITRIPPEQQIKALERIKSVFEAYKPLVNLDKAKESHCSGRFSHFFNKNDSTEPHEEKKLKAPTLLLFLSRFYAFCFLLFALSVVCLLQKLYLDKQMAQYTSLVNYLQRMQDSSDSVLTQVIDALNSASWKHHYNTTRIYGNTSEIVFKGRLDQNKLPSFFQDYNLLVRESMDRDLCNHSDLISDVSYLNGVNCNQIYKGVLSKGYSTAFQSYRANLVFLRQAPFKNLLSAYSFHSQYPVFIESTYFRRLLTRLIDSLIKVFLNRVNQYYASQLTFIKTWCIGFGITTALLIVLACYQIWWFKKKCQLNFSLLCIIPKETLFNIKYTKEMIKNQLLTSLERL